MRAYRLAYDGTPFHGFQRQPDVATVEGTLFDALRALGVLADGKPPGYAAAGRTDAGVSALAQTVAFAAPAWLTPRAINGELPADVRAWASADVPEDFHATRDATSRTYAYHLLAPDASASRATLAAERFVGTHDFHNLSADRDATERAVAAVGVDRAGDVLVLRVRGDGFCREQVRRMVSVVRAVATGEAEPGYVDEVLSDRELDGPEGVPAAPPEPLVLVDVDYPGVTVDVDPAAAASARAVFAERRADRRTAARVAGVLADGITAGVGDDRAGGGTDDDW